MRVGVSILRIKWTRPALADLVEAQAYIAKENPQAAEVIAQRIWDALNPWLTIHVLVVTGTLPAHVSGLYSEHLIWLYTGYAKTM